MQKGTLIQKAEDVKSMKEEISELKKDIEACALITTRYDVLKRAFSQDGVPHQIIRISFRISRTRQTISLPDDRRNNGCRFRDGANGKRKKTVTRLHWMS